MASRGLWGTRAKEYRWQNERYWCATSVARLRYRPSVCGLAGEACRRMSARSTWRRSRRAPGRRGGAGDAGARSRRAPLLLVALGGRRPPSRPRPGSAGAVRPSRPPRKRRPSLHRRPRSGPATPREGGSTRIGQDRAFPTKASKSACCSGSVAAVSSGCHCTPSIQPRSRSMASTRPSPLHPTAVIPSPSPSMPWWW
jgi:hypothetical protein